MKGKVTCTCGWSWNKSDSSAKDMYICHECGRDNSNNMKNGGDIPKAQVGKKIKIKDQRLEGLVTKDNLEDRNVFSPNQLFFKGPIFQKKIKQIQKEAKNPKVVVFAESPKDRNTYSEWDNNLPKELEAIIQEQEQAKATLDSVVMSDKGYKDLFDKKEKLFKRALDLELKYGQDDKRVQQARDNASKATLETYTYRNSPAFQKKITAYEEILEALYNKFRESEFNPKVMDSTFYKEAQNVKDFYKRTDPNTQVDIVPLYGDKKLMQRKLKGMTPFDKFAIFGHYGDRLAGIDNNEIAEYLSKSRVEDCYFGSCGFESQIKNSDLKNLKGKTLNYRPSGNYWWGFNPAGQTFDEAMWSRQSSGEDGPTILPITPNVSYITRDKLENGGWLENYNDSQTSAPEGMVGDGFSNVGRNYSPAWGGQFEDGGEIPMAQTGKATRADSLDVYNRALKIDAYYENLRKKGWYAKKEVNPTPFLTSKELEKEMKMTDEESRKTYIKQAKEKKGEGFLNNMYPNIDPKTVNQKALAEHIKLTKGTKYATKDNAPSIIDPMAPTTVIDTRIIPKEYVVYRSRENAFDQAYFRSHPNMTDKDFDNLEKIKGNKFEKLTPPGGSFTYLYRYDPLSVKPWDMLTDAEKKLRVEKYGTDGVPKSYLNKIKPPDKDKDKSDEIIPIQRPKVEALQPLTQQGVVSNLFSDAKLPVIRPEAKVPKYWDVDFQAYNIPGGRMTFHDRHEGTEQMSLEELTKWLRLQELMNQGYDERYRWDNLRERFPNAPQKWIDKQTEKLKAERAALDVKLTATPHYQMGGVIPIAQDGRATRADSLAVYNSTRAVEDYFKKQGYIKEIVKDTKRHKDSEKMAKSWANEAQKILNAAKKQPLIPGLVTKASKNKQIAEAKGYLNDAQKSLSKIKDEVNPKNYLEKLEDSRVLFNEKGKDVGTYLDEQGNFIEGKPSAEKFYSPIDENRFYQREQSQGFLDLRSPMPLYDERITPQDLSVYISPESIKQDELVQRLMKTKNQKEKDEIEKQLKDIKHSDHVEMYDYDQLAVMPFDLVPPELQQQRVEKYGPGGVPQSVLDLHPEWVTKPMTDPAQRQPVQSLIPLQPAGRQIEASLPVIRPEAKVPKSYNVHSQRYNMKGPSDYYNYNREGISLEELMKVIEVADAYNARILEKYGPQSDYLRSPEVAAERYKQLRQEVDITPNYQMGGNVYPVNYVPKAQFGLGLGLAGAIADKIGGWLSNDEPVKKPVKKAPVQGKPRTLNIVDPRKKMMTTNQPLRPTSDIVTGDYNSKHLDKLMQEAKRQGLSKQDMMNLSAMGFQETKWGRTDGNIGHVRGQDWGGHDSYSDFVNAYKIKMKEADKLGIKDPIMRLQVYNGTGPLYRTTENKYHGFNMQKAYGVPIPPEGISMKKNPLYGKQITDIRDNVLAKNPEYVRYMDSIYEAPLPNYMKQQAHEAKLKVPLLIDKGNSGASGSFPKTKGFAPVNKKAMGGFIPMAQEGQTMFKKPSIVEVEQEQYIDPIYSYPKREPYPSELEFFKENTHVGGMATEDNKVIINPYSPLSDEEKGYVEKLEQARLAMDNGYPIPTFEITPKQQEYFNTMNKGEPYSPNKQDILETIASRIIVGDPTAQDITPEQEEYAYKLLDVLERSKEYATGMSGMMKSKIGMGNAFGHPAIKRMSQAMPKTGMTPEGIGTHYMTSVDNYAVPELQDLGEEELTMVDPDSRSREAIRFNSPEEANYFANHYKEVAPMTTTFRDLNSFQTGGSVPGSVGFTYARTNDPAPSEGPYAKKTMASAQNGGWLDRYDVAQDGIVFDNKGKRYLPNNRALQILADVWKRKQKGVPSPEFSNVKIKDERGEAVTKVDNTRIAPKLKVTDLKKMSVRNKTEAELAEQEKKADEAIAAERKAVREKADANVLNQWSTELFDSDNWTRQNMEDAAAGLESKFRVSDEPNFFDDWINPASWVGRMSANLGAAPNQIVQQDSMMPLVSAIAEPVVSSAIGQIVGPYISKAVKPIKKAVAKGVLPILEGAQSINNKVNDKVFDLISSYRANNKNIMQKAIEAANAGNAWTREWYSNPEIQTRYNEWINPANKFMDPKTALFHSNIENMYPGMSSINLDKSFANKLSGTIARNNLEKLLVEGKFTNPVTNGLGSRSIVGRYSHGLNDALVDITHPGFNKRWFKMFFGKGYDVGNTFVHENTHAITKGDYGFKPEYLQRFKQPFVRSAVEIAKKQLTKHQKYLVKPTEVHARINELRRTFGLSPETVVDDKLMDHIIKQGLKGKTSVEKDFFKLIKDKTKFKELMNTAPAGAIGVGLGAGALQQQREGGVIKDDMGQWNHPGEITEIGSNQITMQGVPYPVLGISDTGDTKLMKPGKNYKFKGKKVTEYPMAKNGLRQEQKGLVNLDQLTNFTNYNKPQPGGWLNKYN